MKSAEAFIPRVALFISEPNILLEIEEILRIQYSSLLIVSEKHKLKEFPFPFIILVDRVKDVVDIRKLHPLKGTRILVILKEADGEVMGAAYDIGADDCITHPFGKDVVIEKIEKYLEEFRQAA